jgi:hypothetical protein
MLDDTKGEQFGHNLIGVSGYAVRISEAFTSGL